MKAHRIAPCFILIVFLALSGSSHAQSPWVLSQSKGNVELYYRIDVCGADSVVFLKFVNNNPAVVTVHWKELFDTQLEAGAAGFSGAKTLVLPPGVTEGNDCSQNTLPDCVILPAEVSPAYQAQIRGFAFTDIVIE
jgi:hypothetical protein